MGRKKTRSKPVAEETGAGGQRYITIAEGAQILRLSTQTIRRYLTERRLTRFKAGGLRTLIDVNEVRAMIQPKL